MLWLCERAILEEDVLDELRIDVRVDKLARLDDVVERHVALKDNQRANHVLAHIVACHSDLQHRSVALVGIFLFLAREQTCDEAQAALRTEGEEESAYFVLKEDDERYHSHADKLVEN